MLHVSHVSCMCTDSYFLPYVHVCVHYATCCYCTDGGRQSRGRQLPFLPTDGEDMVETTMADELANRGGIPSAGREFVHPQGTCTCTCTLLLHVVMTTDCHFSLLICVCT